MGSSSKVRKIKVSRIDDKDASRGLLLVSIQVRPKVKRMTEEGGKEHAQLQLRLAILL
jgi:hypothetical protein